MGVTTQVGGGLRLEVHGVLCRHCGVTINIPNIPSLPAMAADDLFAELERLAAEVHTCTEKPNE